MTEPKRKRRISRVAVLIVLGYVLTNSTAIMYTNIVSNRDQVRAEQSARKQSQLFCQVFQTIDQAYQETPPATKTGKNFAQAIHQLVLDLRCLGG